MLPSTGTVGDSYDNAMTEYADDTYKTELVWRRKPSTIDIKRHKPPHYKDGTLIMVMPV